MGEWFGSVKPAPILNRGNGCSCAHHYFISLLVIMNYQDLTIILVINIRINKLVFLNWSPAHRSHEGKLGIGNCSLTHLKLIHSGWVCFWNITDRALHEPFFLGHISTDKSIEVRTSLSLLHVGKMLGSSLDNGFVTHEYLVTLWSPL